MPKRHLADTSTIARDGGNGLIRPPERQSGTEARREARKSNPGERLEAMAGTATTPQDGQSNDPATSTDAGTQATPPAVTEPAAAAPAQTTAPTATSTQATPPAPGSTVNRQKHERDMAKMQEQLDAKDAELEGYKGLKAEFDAWKAEQETAKTESALKAAGCHDVVAASARLGEFDGELDVAIEKLKEEAPYLFTSTDKSKSTGGKPKGSPDPEDERTKNMRKIMGLDTEKE